MPKDLFVQGHEASASQSDVLLTLTHDGGANDKVRFTVLWATVAAKHSGQVTNDNSARDVYQAFAHPLSYDLGYHLFQTGVLHTFFSFSPQYAADGIGSEFSGTIQPSNFGPSDFGSSLRLYREIVNGKLWVGMNGDGSDSSTDQAPGADLSKDLFVDFDPQSGGSNGKIYDWDAPGHRDLGIPQDQGTVYRRRTNFRFWCEFFESAVSKAVRCSEKADWYSRQSYVRGGAATWAFAGATSGGNNTVTVNSAGWTNDEWKDGVIKIVSGTGMGQVRGIASNSGDTITVSSAWSTNPVNGSSIRLEKKAGWVQLNDINGDNRNGDGSTNTSWNLQ